MWYIYTTKYYSAVEEKEIVKISHQWIELEELYFLEPEDLRRTSIFIDSLSLGSGITHLAAFCLSLPTVHLLTPPQMNRTKHHTFLVSQDHGGLTSVYIQYPLWGHP